MVCGVLRAVPKNDVVRVLRVCVCCAVSCVQRYAPLCVVLCPVSAVAVCWCVLCACSGERYGVSGGRTYSLVPNRLKLPVGLGARTISRKLGVRRRANPNYLKP